ncbi:MAG: DNA-directed RNA polymerase subunit beta [Planctomycetota bacterium]
MIIRDFSRAPRFSPVPSLTQNQEKFYDEFLQLDVLPSERINDGLEAVFREFFPITSFDGKTSIDYLSYDLGEPRNSTDECRKLGLTYGAPLKIKVRLNRSEPIISEVFIGTVPLMIEGGIFIVNGAERVIVTQIQRSPGVDYSDDIHSSGKRLFNCRIIPERGSWIQIETSAKDVLYIKIDRSGKIPATTLLRALSPEYGTTTQILRAFGKAGRAKLSSETAELVGKTVLVDVVDAASGEVLLDAGGKLTSQIIETLRGLDIKTIDVLAEELDPLVTNTLGEDDTVSHEEAIMRIYAKMRPGNPPHPAKALELFNGLFNDERRYSLGEIGRFRINRKFFADSETPSESRRLEANDYFRIISEFVHLRSGKSHIDDIDHLGNRRVRTIKDLVMDEFRKGLVKLSRSVRERLGTKDVDMLTPQSLINSQTISNAIDYFYARGELSQVVDQSNPLAQLTHERRLSALGPGGLNRKRAGFDVRDVHPSHYGRICPIETPEGANIGLIVSLGIYSQINEMGFVITPYARVSKGEIKRDDIAFVRADDEYNERIAQASIPMEKTETGWKIRPGKYIVRYHDEYSLADASEITMIDVSPQQMVGVAASLIPFLEHDDANRALMGSNMQRQAVPLLIPEPPIVSTGMEKEVADNTGMMLYAKETGEVIVADSLCIIVRGDKGGSIEYSLRKYQGLNERTCLNQKPYVQVGDKVKKGQLLTRGAGIENNRLALGRNVLVAYLSWEGTNFEDAILISERLVKNDVFTSIHIEQFTVEVRETKLGKEEITRDIPNVAERALRYLDEDGLVVVGTAVKPGDILVGKISPKSRSELSSEEKLLHAIFGRAGEDVKNDSLIVEPGVEGHVIDVQRFSRISQAEDSERSERRRQNRNVRKIRTDLNDRIAALITEKFKGLEEVIGGPLVNKQTGDVYKIQDGDTVQDIIQMDEHLDLDLVEMGGAKSRKALRIAYQYDRQIRKIEVERDRQIGKLKRGDELPTGVLEMVKVTIAVKRRISVGDKMAGRHGNKGVISTILPEEDMPFLEDGTPIDMVLNPLGVPSRMNFGQILETHLGWAASKLGFTAETPVFNGCDEAQIRDALREAGLPEDGKTILYDGRTGDAFDQKVTVGYAYILKLHHLVADKIHARATGPYSLITQQPLGGKARSGGQRFGEMEVWAIEAYGAANILQELLTVKSDDVDGRTKIYESMVKGDNELDPRTPVSFNVLCNEIRGLGLNIKLEKYNP